ncbi:macro domain-containing protein [Parafrankia sp. EUN1f]|uniref:macro domain-containing protein n=1 Tax=Parafrankia sp. EUN1f TaxID=102897 RepID=UPI0001C43E32|nr:macro domain-containing protein [Parafrankia sp. EUN1f]EFC85483.1 transcriptional regulator, SARP family [Parafrankia sp. EUN1f]
MGAFLPGEGVPRIRVNVLGPARLEVDGREAPLTPLTTRLLVRLIAAEQEVVSAGRLYADVWGAPAGGPSQAQRRRNEVQKRIRELRRALGSDESDAAVGIVRTERMFTGRVPESGYRLILERDQGDFAEFEDLVGRALHAPPASAAEMLSRALGLWRGSPLSEAGGAAFGGALAGRLTGLHETAQAELVRSYLELGRSDLALPVAERAAHERPDDAAAQERLAMVRERLRARLYERPGDEILRRDFPDLHTGVVVLRGDLFEQHDANLVVGFSDTFDIATRDDLVISRDSVQGQLLDRLFAGDTGRLDRELRRGLRSLEPVGRESPGDKRYGKRVRYPVGTVVPLPLDGRRVFAVAYSTLGNDLVARSTSEYLRSSVDRLWASVAVHGLRKPVAMPLVGSGLARIVELTGEQILMMVIDSFVQGCRRYPALTRELRIVVRPSELEKIRMAEVARFVEALGPGGGSRV